MSGNIDSLLKDVVTVSPPQEALYTGLIAVIDPDCGFSSYAMEAINGITTLPLGEAH